MEDLAGGDAAAATAGRATAFPCGKCPFASSVERVSLKLKTLFSIRVNSSASDSVCEQPVPGSKEEELPRRLVSDAIPAPGSSASSAPPPQSSTSGFPCYTLLCSLWLAEGRKNEAKPVGDFPQQRRPSRTSSRARGSVHQAPLSAACPIPYRSTSPAFITSPRTATPSRATGSSRRLPHSAFGGLPSLPLRHLSVFRGFQTYRRPPCRLERAVVESVPRLFFATIRPAKASVDIPVDPRHSIASPRPIQNGRRGRRNSYSPHPNRLRPPRHTATHPTYNHETLCPNPQFGHCCCRNSDSSHHARSSTPPQAPLFLIRT